MKRKYGYAQTSAILFPVLSKDCIGRNATNLLYSDNEIQVIYNINFNSGLIDFKLIVLKTRKEEILCSVNRMDKPFFEFINTTDILKPEWIKQYLNKNYKPYKVKF